MEINIALPGKKTGKDTVSLSEDSFGKDYNEALVHQSVVTYLAGGRQGTVQQKSRSDVRGGGRKPWRQKGTGRARSGTIRSPIWRGGGVTFAARPRDFSKKINKKMYKGAMRCILSELVRQNRLLVVNDFAIDTHKTKDLIALLKPFKLADKLLIVSDIESENINLASRNIEKLKLIKSEGVNVYDLLNYKSILIDKATLTTLVERLK